ncbi:50S ribosomal protein L7/L12 [Candidatus Roizmanbacteria bacterium RIFCSPLOWO2_12_FULL_40_12]|uniref:Large ribosomal subunit protein bL12 n=1 Tax=Candidatus Roizmanbacteria bacterium RIFCSPLOWO2_01_FULL_40_42 TaxID=1802066 RepID=A0A1F7J5G6_9BACT|nr:MAG: 50S ribosomal protein L7/L12 [Candidatus Roizmanbacteria bacterium RIFCSPHIGHO2_01_FULL_40_98]OGK28294.1 MAG: 50S ribosomal protein L7/L12 [Candidatus Roizmanbacteria bacterium RIFCSPHIGHO2_02_FULL_40_53]OGK30530.1 MAG: 50S ribosomal protein L7/L12 [Candidatus Roizmanbacteria bacterium RIFCSPHIGHO2_12_41_18]OGK36944.1 MAG: 50S ribosomal protein L7/L12 [Candidatus Roizmanbacteria bacterium RIFCSPHIGHO2_12_FULL_40_130]OGK50850.1 MAG: 50S ribosomal protein L7/L12 [Candidatus Roizmanbacteri
MADKKISDKVEKIAKEIEGLTVVEAAELSSYLEEKFGVSAMPVAAAAPQGAAQGGEAAEEKTSFTVVLAAAGDNKLGVIKAIREIDSNLGLMEAKKIAESAPQEILKDVKKEPAEEAKKKLEAAGAKVELK